MKGGREAFRWKFFEKFDSTIMSDDQVRSIQSVHGIIAVFIECFRLVSSRTRCDKVKIRELAVLLKPHRGTWRFNAFLWSLF